MIVAYTEAVVVTVMPVPREVVEVPFRENSKQLGVSKSLLYNGSIFKGFQKSKGNSYEVEVVLQVNDGSDYDSIHFKSLRVLTSSK